MQYHWRKKVQRLKLFGRHNIKSPYVFWLLYDVDLCNSYLVIQLVKNVETQAFENLQKDENLWWWRKLEHHLVSFLNQEITLEISLDNVHVATDITSVSVYADVLNDYVNWHRNMVLACGSKTNEIIISFLTNIIRIYCASIGNRNESSKIR